jgi:competence protein ComEA
MSKLKTLLYTLLFLCSIPFAYADVVNINSADAPALAANIVGVGEKRAEAIVAYRSEHGHFDSVDELTQVKGIGDKILEKNRENLRVSDK